MPKDPTELCPICQDPSRYQVEQLDLEGHVAEITSRHRYSRHEVETHMGHLADPEVIRTVSGLAGATAVVARLRQLEQVQGAILEAALTGVELEQPDGTTVKLPPDLNLALKAAREIRSTLVEVVKLAPALDSQQSTSLERTDLDADIEDYLKRRGHEAKVRRNEGADVPSSEGAQEGETQPAVGPGRGAPLALPPAPE